MKYYVTFIGKRTGRKYYKEFEDSKNAEIFRQCMMAYVDINHGAVHFGNFKIKHCISDIHVEYDNYYDSDKVYGEMSKLLELGEL